MPEQFGAVDYAVTISMLVLSLAIGGYFALWARQDSYAEYMLGGRRMGVFPVAMATVASHIGLALVGNPAEVYSYGTVLGGAVITDAIVPIVNISFFLPIFYNLQLSSIYEYLELRFNHNARVLGSFVFAMSQVLYLPAIVYVPALVLNQVSGLSVQFIAIGICCVCMIYTTFGGLKAVLWTDALQNLFSLAAVVFIVCLGTSRLGGVANVMRVNKQGGRAEFFDLDASPFVRTSFLAINVGNMINWTCNLAIHPGAVQCCMSTPTLSSAKRVLVWAAFAVIFVHSITVFMGMMLYTRYRGYDPIAIGEMHKTDQLVAQYVMEVCRGWPGLAGLFVSGVLSAALSSMSSAMNTVAGTLYEDIVELMCRGQSQSDAKQSFITKTISLLVGGACVAIVLLVDKTDSLFQIGMSLNGITNGALLAMFIMGIFIPRANAKGAIAGAVTSVAVVAWVVGHAQYYQATGRLRYPGKHTSVRHCAANHTDDPLVLSRLETYRGPGSPVEADDVPLLYQLSFMYYSLLGCAVGLAVGMLVSLLTQPPPARALDPRLFCPRVHHLLPSPILTDSFKMVQFTPVSLSSNNKDIPNLNN